MVCKEHIDIVSKIPITKRIQALKQNTLGVDRYVSVEQAKLITQAWKENMDKSIIIRRAFAFSSSANNLEIDIEEGELIVGNRSKEQGAGIIFPEGGISWLEREINDLETRPQDKFKIREEDKEYFFAELVPFWKGLTLEENIDKNLDPFIKEKEIVGKLNQKDHAQGHICPDVKLWIKKGPYGLLQEAKEKLKHCSSKETDFFLATVITLEGACNFIRRYSLLALKKAGMNDEHKEEYLRISEVCKNLSENPAKNYWEACQSLWFLITLLQMESNASSFSPGRVDQYLYPYLEKDLQTGRITIEEAQELTDSLFIKFNQIVYLRNTSSAAFFAGFPIGFNIAIGGQDEKGNDASNLLSYIMLRAQEHVKMRQPNLSARIYKGTSEEFLQYLAKVISQGTGMPQIFNDESVIPALIDAGYSKEDAFNYAVVGCVEISTHGNALGFSDAAMFNIVKLLELTLNNGVCVQTGKQLGLKLGILSDFKSYNQLEDALLKQMIYFINEMNTGMHVVEKYHKKCMPSPFLSSVINDCWQSGLDVTSGGAKYNYSGVQLIQVANLADSLAALKVLVYDEKKVDPDYLLDNLKKNYPDEKLRQIMLNHAPKYGNDIPWVDKIADKWVSLFKNELCKYKNYRGGEYTVGLYTVSAHVPMGLNVGATPDGRKSEEPLADGGMSAVYGRDQKGPTALLNSVSRIDSSKVANGSLLNMKFAPQMFTTKNGFNKFVSLLRTFSHLSIHHVQFNVVNKEDLIAARTNPEKYRHLLVRVAGYTANYVDLSDKLQQEIIARTEYGR